MITCDIDGTLLDYNPIYGESKANVKLIEELHELTGEIALVTNQGGLVFGKMGVTRRDGAKYPIPSDFYSRLSFLFAVLHDHGIGVPVIRISTYHKLADYKKINQTARELRNLMNGIFLVDWRVYTTERSRKPNPFILKAAGATIYYGDSEEDKQAAKAAGIEFVKVERFTG